MRSPNARKFVVGYPQVLPDRGLGCWPSLPIGFGDVSYLREYDQKARPFRWTYAADPLVA